MNEQDSRALEILRNLGQRPAAPFHESGPTAYIIETLRGIGLDAVTDDFGNVIAHYRNSASDEPPLALVAHMDHPGFEIVEASERGLLAVALGGVPEVSLSNSDECPRYPRRRCSSALRKLYHIPRRRQQDRPRRTERGMSEINPPVPVVFDLPDFMLDDGFIRMRSLDDLAGCASTLAAIGAAG